MRTTETDNTLAILAGYRADAKAQLAVLWTMLGNCDVKDVQALAVTALAAENTAATVRKLYQVNLEMRELYQRNMKRLAHGLA